MAEVLKDVNANKTEQENNIPIKIIKENIKLFFSALSKTFNFLLTNIFSK